jgi:DNA ligase (NAD+)
MDGIVISTVDYVNENVYYPDRKVAFKVNSEGVPTKVIGVEWNVSMLGSIIPVVLIEPVEIDGTTVGRASAYNAKYILENKIKIGTTVYIIKSGEIIPKIIKVVN